MVLALAMVVALVASSDLGKWRSLHSPTCFGAYRDAFPAPFQNLRPRYAQFVAAVLLESSHQPTSCLTDAVAGQWCLTSPVSPRRSGR